MKQNVLDNYYNLQILMFLWSQAWQTGEFSDIEEEVEFWFSLFPGTKKKERWQDLKKFHQVRQELSIDPMKNIKQNPVLTITMLRLQIMI